MPCGFSLVWVNSETSLVQSGFPGARYVLMRSSVRALQTLSGVASLLEGTTACPQISGSA